MEPNDKPPVDLVAGFAESLQTIDEEFVETVVSTHGEMLKGSEAEASGAEMPIDKQEFWSRWHQFSEPPAPATDGAVSALKHEVTQLSQRLAHLEALVLDLTQQMIPALAKILASEVFLGKTETERAQTEESQPDVPLPAGLDKATSEDSGTSQKGWWSKFRRS